MLSRGIEKEKNLSRGQLEDLLRNITEVLFEQGYEKMMDFQNVIIYENEHTSAILQYDTPVHKINVRGLQQIGYTPVDVLLTYLGKNDTANSHYEHMNEVIEWWETQLLPNLR